MEPYLSLLSQSVALMERGWGENGFLFPTLTPAPLSHEAMMLDERIERTLNPCLRRHCSKTKRPPKTITT